MNTKKKFLLITSMLLLIVMTCCMFAGCKSAEEKENAYYDKAAQAVSKSVTTLDNLTTVLFDKTWTANFMYAFTYYRKTNDDGSVVNDCIVRGDENNAGWPSGANEFVHFIYFEVNFTDKDNYTVKSTAFEDTDRKTYYNNKDKVKNFNKKFKKIDTYTFELKDGSESGQLADEFNPIEFIEANVNKDVITQYGISASDNFRIYTHFMRIESRQVYGEDGIVTRALNDENQKMYWTNYGDDISYNWNNVYGMNNSRLTVLYSKGKSRINQLEIYNEEVISYFTKKDKVDTRLVPKADVVRYHEMVIEFDYKK